MMPSDSSSPNQSITSELLAISKVHDSVQGLVEQYPSLLARLHQSIALIASIKWRLNVSENKSTSNETSNSSTPNNTSTDNTTDTTPPLFLSRTLVQNKKQLVTQHHRISYDCALLDEKLMRQLLALDSITGDEIVRQARKAAVKQITEWIQQCETLKQKINKWEDRAQKLKEWKTPEPPTIVTPPAVTLTPTPAHVVKDGELTSRVSAPPSASGPTSPDLSPLPSRVTQSAPSSPTIEQRRKAAAAPISHSRTSTSPTPTRAARTLTPSSEAAVSSRSRVTPFLRGDPDSPRGVDTNKVFRKYASLHLPRYSPQFQQIPASNCVRILSSLSGVAPEDLQVTTTTSGKLVVRGVKLPSRSQYIRSQQYGSKRNDFGWFENEFEIGAGLDLNGANVSFDECVLEISIPTVQYKPARTENPTPVLPSGQSKKYRKQPLYEHEEVEDENDGEFWSHVDPRAAYSRYRHGGVPFVARSPAVFW